ncbi:hypothetical protein TL16_g03944 [Triparma laevis f. inornata]|uniref:Amine oxidase domain-containing protein n=2 Tax=Triparma laevis TaxID=1534972 RepID=A0A9W7DUQ1_9STRA|nr:hypothetical protein TrLO_g4489 [Triparma laevis f. longispina]GMH64361.1 hypothetical protein TL16_g03944 [Triparma laevis f. inornata]
MDDAQADIYDCVIIGAGAAGLCAGRHLLQHHNRPSPPSLLLLEALLRIGGRVHTTTLSVPSSSSPPSSVRVDLGAEFIHGSTTMINEMVRSNNWPTEEVFTAAQGDGGPDDAPTSDHQKYGVYYLGKEKKLLRYDDEDPDFVKMNESFWSLADLDPAEIDPEMSIADHFESQQISSRMTGMSNAGYSNTSAAPSLSSLSLLRTVEYERHWKDNDGCCQDDGGDCRLSNDMSMSDVIDRIAVDVDVGKNCRLGVKVDRIDWEGDVVKIESSAGYIIRSRTVIVTVPVKILQTPSLLFFHPPLPPPKVSSLSLYGMEDALKLFLIFREPVWPSKVQNCILSDSPIPEMWFRSTPSNLHICCCFATSTFASNLKILGEVKAVDIALNLLSSMFTNSPQQNKSHLLSTHMISWSSTPSILGGYSYPKVGMSESHVKLIAEPLESKVFFAGEHTHVGAGMTVHAAMETGIMAAQSVLNCL